jgi:hypothetical protein
MKGINYGRFLVYTNHRMGDMYYNKTNCGKFISVYQHLW